MDARINPIVASQLVDILARQRTEPASQTLLLVTARTLSDSPEWAMTATTAVGVIDEDDVDELRLRVQDIAEELGLDASVALKTGSFSVRFSRKPADRRGVSG